MFRPEDELNPPDRNGSPLVHIHQVPRGLEVSGNMDQVKTASPVISYIENIHKLCLSFVIYCTVLLNLNCSLECLNDTYVSEDHQRIPEECHGIYCNSKII